MEDDLYEILGVLPSAEDIVITAAYRVLAQRYHPDRWSGSPEEAHARMTSINRAYDTLKDSVRRAEYDRQRSRASHSSYERQSDPARGAAFQEAVDGLEARWKVAVDVFPDLVELRAKLNLLSPAIAFSFVTMLLERKTFKDRRAVAEEMQSLFLERYFGTDEKIKDFAKELIDLGARDAAKMLNELVDVLGSEIIAEHLIDRVHRTHGDTIRRLRLSRVKNRHFAHFKRCFELEPTFGNLRDLCETAGYSVGERGQGLFNPVAYEVECPSGQILLLHSREEFIDWGIKEFS